MFLWDFVLSIFQAMTAVFWLGKGSMKKNLCFYIKSNDGQKVSVNLDPSMDIKSVKEIVGPKLGLESEEIKIILGGKELDDSVTIEVYSIWQSNFNMMSYGSLFFSITSFLSVGFSTNTISNTCKSIQFQ